MTSVDPDIFPPIPSPSWHLHVISQHTGLPKPPAQNLDSFLTNRTLCTCLPPNYTSAQFDTYYLPQPHPQKEGWEEKGKAVYHYLKFLSPQDSIFIQ